MMATANSIGAAKSAAQDRTDRMPFAMSPAMGMYMAASCASILLLQTDVIASVSLFILRIIPLLPGVVLVVLISLLLIGLTGLVGLRSLVGLMKELTARTVRGV